METRMQRADPTAPTTPEQYRAALDRQDRVIQKLHERLQVAERSLKVLYTWAGNDALDPQHVMDCCTNGLGRGDSK